MDAIRLEIERLARAHEAMQVVGDYLERMGMSHFCLVPGGTSPWTNHLSAFAFWLPSHALCRPESVRKHAQYKERAEK